tara:strand:+ start:4017 stop:4301 length:285 start_codon:yes stop_codon:yes gene_type:complete
MVSVREIKRRYKLRAESRQVPTEAIVELESRINMLIGLLIGQCEEEVGENRERLSADHVRLAYYRMVEGHARNLTPEHELDEFDSFMEQVLEDD